MKILEENIFDILLYLNTIKFLSVAIYVLYNKMCIVKYREIWDDLVIFKTNYLLEKRGSPFSSLILIQNKYCALWIQIRLW